MGTAPPRMLGIWYLPLLKLVRRRKSMTRTTSNTGISSLTPNGGPSGLIHNCKEQAKGLHSGKTYFCALARICSFFSDFSWLDTVMTTDIDYLLTPVCAITILILSPWLSQNLPVPFQSFSGVGRKLPLLRVTSSIGWLCGGCSLGWGYCTDRLDLDDLQTPTVAAKALGPTLHVQNFSGLIWKFEIWTNKDSQDYPFWFCDMGLVPTLGCTLGCTLFHFAPKTSPQERFRTVLNYCGGVYTWCVGTFRPVFGNFFACTVLLCS